MVAAPTLARWLERPGRYRTALAAAGVHLVLAASFLSPALLSGGVVLPAELLHAIYPWGAYFQVHTNHNEEITDAILVFFPFFERWKDAVLHGEWPLWNPDSGLGLPFAANAQSACYFPLTALSLLGVRGWNLLLVLRLFMAGLGTFFLLRRLGRSLQASLLGSIAFAYSLPFALWLPGPLTSVNALLPLLFFTAYGVGQRPGPRTAAGFGATLLAMHLAGNPEYTFLNAGAATLAASIRSARQGAPNARRALGWLSLGGAVGTLAAAVQIIPFLEYLFSSRGWIEHSTRTPFTVPPLRALTWFVPLFFGRPMDHNFWPGGVKFIDSAAFAGAASLGLALTAVAFSRVRRLLPLVIPLVAVVTLAYGIPPVSWLRHVAPLDRVMIHRSLHIAALCIAGLAAYGWDVLRASRRLGGRKLALRLGLLAPLALMALAGLGLAWFTLSGVPAAALSQTALPAVLRASFFVVSAPLLAAVLTPGFLQRTLVTILIVADLWHAIFNYHGSVPRSQVFFRTGATDFLAGQPGRPRVLPLNYSLPPNTNLLYGISSPLSFDAMDSLKQAQFLRNMRGYLATGLYCTVFPAPLSNVVIAELASLEFFLDDPLAPRLDTPSFEARSGFRLRRVYEQPDGRIYRLETARPRVWYAGKALRDPGFVRFQQLIAQGSRELSSLPYLDSLTAPEGEGQPGSVTGVVRRTGEIQVTCTSRGSGWLFFSEGYMPGWKASVNGRRAEVVQASGPFFAVAVPSGESTVRVEYRPASFFAGLWVTGAGLLLLTAMGLLRSRVTPGPRHV